MRRRRCRARACVSATPALFTTMSSVPGSRRSRVDRRRIAHVERDRAAPAARARGSRRRRRRAPTCAAPRATTCAPCAASNNAKCRPRPLDAPGHERAPARERIGGEQRHDAFPSRRRCARSRSTFFWILPVAVFGSGAEHDLLRHLEMRDAVAAPVDDLGGRHALRARLQRHERARRLAPVRIRPRDHRRLHHLRMAVQALLDLERADVLAARDDDVLAAVLDLDVAVRMPDGEVAGVVPAVRERRLRRRRRS